MDFRLSNRRFHGCLLRPSIAMFEAWMFHQDVSSAFPPPPPPSVLRSRLRPTIVRVETLRARTSEFAQRCYTSRRLPKFIPDETAR